MNPLTSRRIRGLAIPTLVCALALASTHANANANANASEQCGPHACVSGAEWSSGEQLDDSERAREAKRNRSGKNAQLSVQLNSGRGSVFIDGVWVAPVPALYVPIKPGKHDLEVRDGQQVLARGVLTIPKKAGDVTVRVF